MTNIGVPRDHQLADRNSPAGESNLYNLKIGPIEMPCAPTFVVRLRNPTG